VSLFGKDKPAETPAPAVADPPVTRAEFGALDATLKALAESVRDLAQRPVIVQSHQPEAPPMAAEITDEGLDAAVAEGKGAGHIKELIDRRVAAAKREAAAEIGTVREYGTTMLGSLAERTFIAGLSEADKKLLVRYEKEVRGLLSQCEPALRGHPDTWQACFNNVKGVHSDELANERVEGELRRRADEATAAAAPQPGSRTARGASGGSDDDDAIPTVAEVLGDKAEFFGEMDEADFIRRINRGKPASQKYKDWNDYVTRGRAIDKELAAIRGGLTGNGDEAMPKGLQ